MEYITITDFQGIKFSGFEISSRRNLPKSAILINCTYTEDFKDVNVYLTAKKTYIFTKK
jgi:hypothetical protein